MKTIADYQPDTLIERALGLLARLATTRKVDGDATMVMELQVSFDMLRQDIDFRYDELPAWVAQAIEERRAALAK